MSGEPTGRVIPGTRRPDGTVRKEIRVRAGYVPLDEQPVYQSRGAKFRDASKSHVPGMDPAALEAAKAANAQCLKSKSSKKNERRKEKRVSQKPSAAGKDSVVSVNGLGDSLQLLNISADGRAAGAPAAISAVLPDGQDSAADIAKQIRALKKKLRQCEVLKREHDAGEELTGEETRKLSCMTDWQQELQRLET